MPHGPVVTVTEEVVRCLASMAGAPVRLTVLDATTGERRFRLHGVTGTLTSEGLAINMVNSVPSLGPGSPVAVEALINQQVVWFHTLVSPGHAPCHLLLQVPARLEMAQRRRHPRLDLDLPVHLVVKATGQVLPARLRDLSAGGASLATGEPIVVGESVSLIASLGSGVYFHDLPADLLRCSPLPDQSWLVAVRFDCTPQQQAALAAWVGQFMTGSSCGTQ